LLILQSYVIDFWHNNDVITHWRLVMKGKANKAMPSVI